MSVSIFFVLAATGALSGVSLCQMIDAETGLERLWYGVLFALGVAGTIAINTL